MARVPLGETKGLADEVFAWHAAASPYVHTHQGNFPRLFAFLIYLLGARTIESQIILTTLTVGLASIWFAFRFLCTLGPPLFAALGCLVLITDYGLFGQWQFDTYRVWYGFFFFGSLLWVSVLERRRGWPIVAVRRLNFAALFYGEYVFATFVAITAAGYASRQVCWKAGMPSTGMGLGGWRRGHGGSDPNGPAHGLHGMERRKAGRQFHPRRAQHGSRPDLHGHGGQVLPRPSDHILAQFLRYRGLQDLEGILRVLFLEAPAVLQPLGEPLNDGPACRRRGGIGPGRRRSARIGRSPGSFREANASACGTGGFRLRRGGIRLRLRQIPEAAVR